MAKDCKSACKKSSSKASSKKTTKVSKGPSKNPYIFFSKTIRPEVVKENPNLKAKEILKVIAAKWRELSEEEKNDYKKKAEEQ